MKSLLKSSRAWICLTVLIGGLFGCVGPAPSPASPGEPAAAPVAEQAPASAPLEIAVIPKGLAHQFWLTVKAGAEAAGKELGAEIIWQGPAKETEIAKQINIVEDMISREVDAIVLAACDENALIQKVQQALDAKIPVVTMDSGVKSDLPFSFVATDNVAGARLAADTLAGLIGDQGMVGVIPFVAGAATSEMREQGFKEGIAQHPNIALGPVLYCDSDVAKAMNVTNDMLTANADLRGIFATNEPAAIGAAQALKTAGKAGTVKLVAFDGAEEEIAALKEGAIQALVVQNPYKMGYESVKAAVDAIHGKEVPKRIDTGVTVVTADNL
ncbi:MAG: ABC transporter substrate-binding protein, partial [Candidatus Hydrogenedentes bacterium]|nr:ABC transporter substrate-binding protein [Candidatus Hydrogenedentota bacterium]